MNSLIEEIVTQAKVADGKNSNLTNVSANMTRQEIINTAASCLRLLNAHDHAQLKLDLVTDGELTNYSKILSHK